MFRPAFFARGGFFFPQVLRAAPRELHTAARRSKIPLSTGIFGKR